MQETFWTPIIEKWLFDSAYLQERKCFKYPKIENIAQP